MKSYTCPFCFPPTSAASVVFARVCRHFQAVGKTPEKVHNQKLQTYFPGTIPPVPAWPPACPAPHGGTLLLEDTLSTRNLPSPARHQGFPFMLKIHFQKGSSAHERSIQGHNRQLCCNNQELSTSLCVLAETIKEKTTTLLQNGANLC